MLNCIGVGCLTLISDHGKRQVEFTGATYS
jgi:hypothetical protein